MARTTVLASDRVAVTELRADFQLAGQARDGLDQVLADHAGVGGRATGGDIDFLDVPGQAQGSG